MPPPRRASGPPPVVNPGRKPPNAPANNLYVGKETPERHPAGSILSYTYLTGGVSYSHK